MLSHRVGPRGASTDPPVPVTSSSAAQIITTDAADKTRRRGKKGSFVATRILFLLTFVGFLLFGCTIYLTPADDRSVGRSQSDSFLHHRAKNATETVRLTDVFYKSPSGNFTIKSQGNEKCRRNAIVILAQKKHATYHRDSYGLLLRAMDLLAENYLRLGKHAENTDVFLFHTGDFDAQDLVLLESILSVRRGILKLVDLRGTAFWELPSWHAYDNQADWVDSDIFPVGYRHMCRWFGVKIWQFFEELNTALACSYRHLLRIDEDSLILSPINYDIFDFMLANKFVYGFRLCAYELEYNRRIAPWLGRWKVNNPMKREMHRDLCGFYNNFFVADLDFFNSPPVRKYLRTLDRQGFIYRKRYGDLMIHSTAVYAYAEPSEIHRFLDFTYSHVTRDHVLNPEQGCVVWGGIQGGYADLNAEKTLNEYYQESVLDRKCTANVSIISEKDLSPTYQHVPPEWKGKVALKTIVAGKVELPSQGEYSG